MDKKWGLLVGLWMLVGSAALRAQDPSNVHYIYDAAGQLVGSVDANGNAKTYSYDAAGNLTSVERLLPRGDVDILFVNPNRGGPGTRVNIFGIGFSEAPPDNQVTFNGASAWVEASTAGSITVLVPEGATTGPVRVTSPAGTAVSRSDFTVEAACASLSGLVSWWPGERNANDIIGSNHGRLVGAAFARGKVGHAFSLGGVSQYVDIPTINVGRTFSIEFWIFPPRASSNRQEVISYNPNGRENFGGLLLVGDHLEYWRYPFRVETPAGSVPANAWSHVALTYDGVTVRLYINGTLRATGAPHDMVFNNPLRLGYPFGGQYFFGGLLDEVSLYNRALTVDEIQAIVNAGGVGKCKRLSIVTTQLPDSAVGRPVSHQIQTRFGVAPLTFSIISGSLPPGLALDPQTGLVSGTPTAAGTFTITVQVTDAAGAVATASIRVTVGNCLLPPDGLVSWWSGDGNTTDVTGNNHGTLQNGVAFAPGKVGQAFSFNGVNQYVDIPTINLGRTFSVELWVFPTRASDGVQPLVANAPYDRAAFGGLGLVGDRLRYAYLNGPGIETPAGSVPVNTWSHVALTYDGVVVRLYINGALRATSPPHDEVFNNPLRLGDSVAPWTGYFFGGLLDEVSLYNRALTADEVQAIFGASTIGKCKPLYIVTTQLPDMTVKQPASFPIETQFGAPPLAFEVTSGDLPPGLTLDPDTGVVSGTPTTAGTFTFTVQVTDATGATATRPIRARVSPM